MAELQSPSFGGPFTPPFVSRRRESEFRAATERARVQSEQRQKDLAYQGKVRELLEDAYDRFSGPDDKPELNATLQSIFKSIEQESGGKKVNPVVQKYLTDPQKAKELLDFTRESGITLGDLFTMTGDPLSTATALVAFGKARQRGRFAASLPGAEKPEGAPAAPATAAPEPTGPFAADAARMTARLKFLEASRARVAASAPDPQSRAAGIASIDAEMKQIREDLSKITTGRALTIEIEQRTPIGQAEVDDARREAIRAGFTEAQASRMFFVGQPRSQFQDRKGFVGPATPTPAPALDKTPRQPALLPEQRALQKLEAEEDSSKRRAAFEAFTRSSFKSLDEIKDIGTKARRSADTLEVVAAAALRLGPSGEWVTPLRNVVDNALTLLGKQDLVGKSAREVITGLNARLATEITSMQKGQQSDKELALALASAPGAFNTNKGLAVMTFVAAELAKKAAAYDVEARAWAARHTERGGLDAVDEKGRSFQDVWEAKMRNYNKQFGSLADRTSKAFRVDSKALLRGIVKDAK